MRSSPAASPTARARVGLTTFRDMSATSTSGGRQANIPSCWARSRSVMRVRELVEAGEALEVLGHCEAEVEAGGLRHDRDALADRLTILRTQRDPGDRCPAGSRGDQRAEGADCRRLAGAIRTEEAEDLAIADLERDVAEGEAHRSAWTAGRRRVRERPACRQATTDGVRPHQRSSRGPFLSLTGRTGARTRSIQPLLQPRVIDSLDPPGPPCWAASTSSQPP